MKKASIIAALLIASAATSFAQSWSIDKAHSRLGFNVTHMGISETSGTFKITEAKITSSKPDFSDAVVELVADVKSVDTDNEQRDKHLAGADFFDAEKFPSLSFKSTSWKKVSDKKFKVTGNLTFHGVTKPVTLDVTFNGTVENPMSKKTMAGFNIGGIVKRSEFGVAASMPATMLGDNVSLQASTEFAKD